MFHNKYFINIIFSTITGTILIFISGCSGLKAPLGNKNSTCKALDCHGSTVLKEYPPVTGKHAQHLAAGLLCENCHFGYISKTTHKNGRVDGNLNLTPSNPYAEKIVYFADDMASISWDSSAASCSNISCHLSRISRNSKNPRIRGSFSVRNTSTISWYNDSPGCTTCHMRGSIIDPLSTNGSGVLGKHIVHVENGGVECEACHSGYKNSPAHMNGTYGISEPDTIVIFGSSYNGSDVISHFVDDNGLTGRCDNISCHGTSSAADWYADASGCNLCHSPGSAIDPLTTSGSGTSGKHTAHVSLRGIECEVCHKGYRGSPAHMNSLFSRQESENSVSFSGTFPSQGGKPVTSGFNGSTGECSSISCHGGTGGVTWFDAGTGCTLCHKSGSANDPIAIDAGYSGNGQPAGKHEGHVKNLSNPKLSCEKCHRNYPGLPTHMNGVLDGKTPGADSLVSFDPQNTNGLWTNNNTDYSNITCRSMTCHGSANWYGDQNQPMACTLCHSGGSEIDPVAINGSGADGKHEKHVLTLNLPCEKCHYNYKSSSTHANGTMHSGEASAAITFFDATNSGGQWAGDTGYKTGSCTNLACHGTSITLNWYGGNTMPVMTCPDCHKGTAGGRRQVFDSNGDGSGTGGDFNRESHHVIDYSDRTRQIVQGSDCEVCHDQANHMSGTIRLKDKDNSGQVIVYNPADLSSLEPFCLSCHDSNGAAADSVPLKPFNSGDPNALGTEPNYAGVKIKENWDKSYGHRRQGMTCMEGFNPDGTRKYTGCHGGFKSSDGRGSVNAHGSDNKGLLANKMVFENSESPFTWDEGDYRLCFDCHSTHPSIPSKERLFGVGAGGNYDQPQAGNFVWPYEVDDFMGIKFHDDRSYGYDRQYNLHTYHLMVGGWAYRSTTGIFYGGGFLSTCVTCHSVHGVSRSDSYYLWDEWNYSIINEDGVEYGAVNKANVAGDFGCTWGENCGSGEYGTYPYGPEYPEFCAVNCHWQGSWPAEEYGGFRYPRTFYNEARAATGKVSGPLQSGDTVTIYFSSPTNGLSIVSGNGSTGPDYGIDKVFRLTNSHSWGTVTAAWSESNTVLTVSILTPAANPVSVNDRIIMTTYNDYTINGWSILDSRGTGYRGIMILKGGF